MSGKGKGISEAVGKAASSRAGKVAGGSVAVGASAYGAHEVTKQTGSTVSESPSSGPVSSSSIIDGVISAALSNPEIVVAVFVLLVFGIAWVVSD